MSFEEKSVWIQLGALLCVLIGYGFTAGKMLTEGMLDITRFSGPIITAVIAVIVLTIIGHIVAAIQNRPEKRDERDRLIECKSKTLSTHLLEFGALVALILLVAGINPVWSAHVLLGSLFLEEIARQILSIAFYRRGI